jgi:hypothetical protein
MTYADILGQVAGNLGWDGFEDQYSRNIKFAMFWALQELTAESGALKADIQIQTYLNKESYPMPDDFLKPSKVLFSEDGSGIETFEVEYGELLLYKLGNDTETNARYSDKTLYAFHRSGEGTDVYIFPTFTGIAYITYEQMVNEQIDVKSQMSPPIHPRFHSFIIDGATFYLARKQIAEIAKEKNPELLAAWENVVNSYDRTFTQGKEKFAVYSQQRAETAQIKGYNFYDKPESYY